MNETALSTVTDPARSPTVGHPVLRQTRRARSTPDELGVAAEMQALIDDLIDTMHDANGAGIAAPQVGESVRDRGDRGRPQPALPVQAADPADRRRQPGDRAARRRDGRDQRGLPVGAQPARQRAAATSTSASAGSTVTASRTTRSAAVSPPARSSTSATTSTACCSSTGSPTRRRSRPGSSSSASTATPSSSASPSSSTASGLTWHDGRRTTASWRGSAAEPARSPTCVESRSTAVASSRVDAGRRPRRAGAVRLAGLTLPGSPTPTVTPSTAPCGDARTSGPRLVLDVARRDVRRRRRRSTPDRYHRLARAVFAEMVLAGITAVGEFHYVHHQAGGTPYDDPNEMGDGARRRRRRRRHPDHAARHVLPPRRDRGTGPIATRRAQLRFSDGAAERWAERGRRQLGNGASASGSVPPSTRCGPSIRAAIDVVADWAATRGAPLHAHVSEQPAENEQCLARLRSHAGRGARERGALGPAFTAVHATHLTDERHRRCSARRRCSCCLCPTTERDLADGVGAVADAARRPARASRSARDSHAVIDLFEEARAVELDERLVQRRARAATTPRRSLRMATGDGHIAPGLARRRSDRAGRTRRPRHRRPRLGAHRRHRAERRARRRRLRRHRRRRDRRRDRRASRRARRPPRQHRRRRRARARRSARCWRRDACR